MRCNYLMITIRRYKRSKFKRVPHGANALCRTSPLVVITKSPSWLCLEKNVPFPCIPMGQQVRSVLSMVNSMQYGFFFFFFILMVLGMKPQRPLRARHTLSSPMWHLQNDKLSKEMGLCHHHTLSYVKKVNNLSKGGYKGEETGLSVGYVNVLLLG